MTLVARHALAAAATRDGVRALGLSPWVEDASASNLVTAVRLPDGVGWQPCSRTQPESGTPSSRPELAKRPHSLVRLNHTGQRARRENVLANVLALGQALHALGRHTERTAAADAVAARYAGTG